MRYNNLAFWSWNGEMTAEEIDRQVKSMKAAKFGGFFIHARAGLKIPYMQDAWFDAVQCAIDSAQACGLEVWLYDENGWPSGFAGGKVPAYGEDVWVKTLHFGSEVPKDGIQIARYRKEGDAYVQSAEGSLFAYYRQDRHYVDLLHPKTVEYFLENTHEVYRRRFGKYFGNAIRGIFTDEPQLPCGLVWSTGLEEEFRKAYGQDLIGQLWKFFCKGGHSEFRYDFYSLIADLFERRFTQPIGRWCSQNGLVMTGHFSSEESLCMQTVMSGGVARNYEYMQMPGIDHLGRKFISPVALRQLEGVKNQLGKEMALSETFGCTGWGVSFPQLCALWTEQALAGINRACLHLAAYTIKGSRKRDYPAHFSYQEPWWERFDLLSGWMENLNEFLSAGKPKNRVGVISALSGCRGEIFYGAKQRYISNQFRLLIENLQECQIDFEVIDETILKRHGFLSEEKLCVGESRFEYVIVADTDSLLAETAELLLQWSAAGGQVLFCNRYPTRLDGRTSETAKKLRAISRFDTIQNRADLWRKFFESRKYRRYAMLRVPMSEKISKEVTLAVRHEGDRVRCAVWNRSEDRTMDAELCFLGQGAIVEFDLTTRETRDCASEQKREYACSDLHLKPQECRCFFFEEGKERGVAKEYRESTQEILFRSVRLGENVFTLDYVQIAEEGQDEYSPKIPVAILQDKLHEMANARGREITVRIRYAFCLEFVPSALDLVWEYEDCRALWVNGERPENVSQREWCFDRCMKRISIARFLHVGQNEVTMEYRASPIRSVAELEEVYETAKNAFSYPSEPEAIYLIGNFDVIGNGITKQFAGLRTSGPFRLTEATKKDPARELTEQGAWFYRGKAVYETYFEGSADAVCLEFSHFCGALVDVYVNDALAGSVYTPGMRLDITSYANEGKNKLTAVLYSTNRNVFGPHHHYKEDPEFVGVNTFKGVRGYEDEVVNFDAEKTTWVDTYAFGFFGLGRCRILKREYRISSKNK